MAFPLHFRLAVVLKRARSSAVLTSLAGKTRRNQISQDVEGGFLGLEPCASASKLLQSFPCPSVEGELCTARGYPQAPEEEPSGQGGESRRSWPGVLQPNHTFPPLLPQSLQLKFHRQGQSEGRQEQTCFWEGGLNFLPEWAFAQGELRKCSPTAISSTSSVQESHR